MRSARSPTFISKPHRQSTYSIFNLCYQPYIRLFSSTERATASNSNTLLLHRKPRFLSSFPLCNHHQHLALPHTSAVSRKTPPPQQMASFYLILPPSTEAPKTARDHVRSTGLLSLARSADFAPALQPLYIYICKGLITSLDDAPRSEVTEQCPDFQFGLALS
jgi:hypothetical protein